MSHGADSRKSILYALGANFAIFVAKTCSAIITGSGSMMAESVHSLADCGNQLLLLLGLKHAKKPPSPDYPLGFGKAVYFWSFIVALILFSMGGLYSIYEGFHKLHSHEPLKFPLLAVIILLFSIVAESISMWGCVREVNKDRGSKSLLKWLRETRQSDLLVVFGEDLAALLGLITALIAVVMTMLTGNPVYDAMGSIAIGFILVIIALFIGYEVHALLIGQGVEVSTKKEMLNFLEQQEKIDKVFNLLTLQLGKDVMVAVKAKMTGIETTKDLIVSINEYEKNFKEQFPSVLWLFFEPDIKE